MSPNIVSLISFWNNLMKSIDANRDTMFCDKYADEPVTMNGASIFGNLNETEAQQIMDGYINAKYSNEEKVDNKAFSREQVMNLYNNFKKSLDSLKGLKPNKKETVTSEGKRYECLHFDTDNDGYYTELRTCKATGETVLSVGGKSYVLKDTNHDREYDEVQFYVKDDNGSEVKITLEDKDYNGDFEIIQTSSQDGDIKQQKYDSAGRVIKEDTYSNENSLFKGNQAINSKEVKYHSNGKVKEESKTDHINEINSRREFDMNGKLIKETIEDKKNGYTIYREFDANDNIKKEIYTANGAQAQLIQVANADGTIGYEVTIINSNNDIVGHFRDMNNDNIIEYIKYIQDIQDSKLIEMTDGLGYYGSVREDDDGEFDTVVNEFIQDGALKKKENNESDNEAV